ncbi:MAG: hypothetical protein FWH36_04610 [Lentimicrobiaceae bacterium]|nr:hypothetical protein [Lentimicrobiaceae bacterium]
MRVKSLTTAIAASVVLSFFLGCSPEMEIPSYIWIDSVDFQVTNAGQHGTASHRITDVWLIANGKSLGMYQIPARIPILESGTTKLQIEAGIMLGGVPQARARYPFYSSYITDVNLKKGKIDTLQPYFTYTNNTEIWEKEDFETAGILYEAYGTSAPLKRTSDEALKFYYPKEINNYSGMVELPYYNDTLDKDIYHFEIRTIKPVTLTSQHILDCLMEINFRITHNVEVGMIIHYANTAIADRQVAAANLTGYDDLSSQDNVWRKVYVNFTQIINETSQMQSFDVYIRGTIPSNEKARFLFDNIKLIHNTR